MGETVNLIDIKTEKETAAMRSTNSGLMSAAAGISKIHRPMEARR
jgi:hypothetical protein